jgi:hypothetical protein
LGAAALDALALLGLLGIELGKVNLADHLERSLGLLCCRGLHWGRGGGFLYGRSFGFLFSYRFRFYDGLRFHNGLRLHDGLGFYDRLRFRFGLGYGSGLLYRGFFGHGFGLRFHDGLGLCDRFGIAGQIVALDHGNALRLELVLFLLRFLAGLVQDLGQFDVHFLGRLFQFQVFAELLVKLGEELVRNLQVRIGVLDAGTLGIQELHEGIQPDIELFNKFR